MKRILSGAFWLSLAVLMGGLFFYSLDVTDRIIILQKIGGDTIEAVFAMSTIRFGLKAFDRWSNINFNGIMEKATENGTAAHYLAARILGFCIMFGWIYAY